MKKVALLALLSVLLTSCFNNTEVENENSEVVSTGSQIENTINKNEIENNNSENQEESNNSEDEIDSEENMQETENEENSTVSEDEIVESIDSLMDEIIKSAENE